MRKSTKFLNQTIWLMIPVFMIFAMKAYADITPASEFCQRLQLSEHQCMEESKEWSEPLTLFKNHIIPTAISTADDVGFKVLILSPKWSTAYDIATKTIIEQFASQGLNVSYTLLNYQQDKDQAKVIIDIAENLGVDLIFSVGSSTTAFMFDYYSTGKLPVVSVCSKDPVSLYQVDGKIGMSQSNIAYTSLNIDVSTQIDYFKEKFLIGLSRIAIIYDINNPSSIQTQVSPLINYLEHSDNIELTLIEVDLNKVNDGLAPQMKKFIEGSQKPGDSIFLITGSTELFENIDRINKNAMALPVLSVTPSHVTSGLSSVLMAIGVSFKTNAKLAADYGARILQKKAIPQTLPIGIVDTPDISINFSRMPENTSLKLPFKFFEDAVVIYNHKGEAVRIDGYTQATSRCEVQDC
ncbi:hypothetical protein CJF42_06045 [Pseudoalteromonas sp. NBT06-2]|uniref:hypothetical protein n=1 Tax=Pseudoalteromonas sp. NBT06-2 TaxID=2025950 RepID=UPI000BA5E062|nr:hypothetical protein [Pseudoalteromonas sp. NBT06-2]PAJ75209.1 hypothetical protein CJF42_06045 [Pseudoalteromonas sp. NBT06-2]